MDINDHNYNYDANDLLYELKKCQENNKILKRQNQLLRKRIQYYRKKSVQYRSGNLPNYVKKTVAREMLNGKFSGMDR